MKILISIIICTYNRAELLKRCLQSFYEQSSGVDTFEVIVVDNNSTDNTREVIRAFDQYPCFRYLLEPRQGLSIARNLGLAQACGEFVAYIDDDVLIPPGWLHTLIHLIETNKPALQGLGGPLYPFYTTPKPDWFDDKYAVQMGSRKESFFLNAGQSFIGANMIWERKFLQSINGFRPEFGYSGNLQTLGEETDAYFRAWKAKPTARFLYSPDLQLKHWLPPEKMTLSFRINRCYKHGLTNYHIGSSSPNQNKARFLFSKFIILGKLLLKSLFKIGKYRYWQQWVYCEFALTATPWGEICGVFGKKLSKSK